MEPLDALPLLVFEDEHLLVINKPAGLNTHAPSPYAGEGVYEWLKNREPRWATLSILHRLDKETSGLLVFGKTTAANRSLTAQFTAREVEKKYLLLTDRSVAFRNLTAKSALVRAGAKYLSRPMHAGADEAETEFTLLPERILDHAVVAAEPFTGRTHQIRVHAAEHGFPILGDTLYGGTAAARLYLHAAEISFCHPVTGEKLTFSAKPDFEVNSRAALRSATIDPTKTNAFRIVHGSSDGEPGWYVEKYAACLLSQSEQPLTPERAAAVRGMGGKAVYHKTLNRHVRGASTQQASPQLVFGDAVPEEIVIRENGVQFAIRFNEGYSVGIFLDQRENRRRLLTGYIAPEFFLSQEASKAEDINGATLSGMTVLNTFAYTCAFSVCAAIAGAQVTSLDLSKKYLEWGKRNFELNGIDASQHDFIYGDTFDWLRRFARKGRTFDMVLLDPPTFSQSKEHGVFRAEKDYGKLVAAALGVLKPGGVLFCSTNAAELIPEKFLETIAVAIRGENRAILRQHYVPQPIDFPISRNEPAYLKTVWTAVR